MKLTKQAIDSITVDTRLKLGLALGFSEQWIIKLLDANKPNSPLTTMAAVKVLREETGLTDQELLTEEVSELMGQ